MNYLSDHENETKDATLIMHISKVIHHGIKNRSDHDENFVIDGLSYKLLKVHSFSVANEEKPFSIDFPGEHYTSVVV